MTSDPSRPSGRKPREERRASAELLRLLRAARGLTQAGWAAALNTAERTVQRWERGEAVPDAMAEATLIAYCREHGLFERLESSNSHWSVESLQAVLARARTAGNAINASDVGAPDNGETVTADPLLTSEAEDNQGTAETSGEDAQSSGRTGRQYAALAALAVVTLLTALFIVRYVVPPGPCIPNSRFLEDVNVPDGTIMRPGTSFQKEWRLINPDAANICPWSRGFNAVWNDGPNLATASSFDIPEARPGEQVTVSVPMVAPRQPGTYRSVWILRTPQGTLFGDRFWVEIEVRE